MQSTTKIAIPVKRWGWRLAPAVDWSTVPFYRKRWFAFLTVLLFVPATLLIMWTGGVYFERKDGVYEMPKAHKAMLTLLAIASAVVNLIRHT